MAIHSATPATRARILEILSLVPDGGASAREVQKRLGYCAPKTIKFYLEHMVAAGLVERAREGCPPRTPSLYRRA